MMASLDQDDRAYDAFRLFRKLVPTDFLNEFDVGHAGIYSAWIVVWLMTCQRLLGNASLSRAVAELKFGAVARCLPDCKRARDGEISSNTGGYSQARSLLPVEVDSRVVDHIFDRLVDGQPASWNGRRVFLVDGTTLSLSHHPELLEQFPPAENQHGKSHWPIVNLVTAHELGSGLATRPEWGAMYGPNAVSETRLAKAVMQRLGGPAMIVADRNFGIFSVAFAAVEFGHGVVVRLKDDRFDRMVAAASPIEPGQWRLDWRPSRWDRRANPDLPNDAVIEGRVIEITIEHEGKPITLRLFTTDLTTSPEEIAALYGLRWRVENDIRDMKQTMCMDRLNGQGVDMISREILLGIVAYNLVVEVKRQAASRVGIEPRRLSFKRTLDLLQAFQNGFDVNEDAAAQNKRYERLLDAVSRCRLPERSKHRSYPRTVIPRTRGFPSHGKGGAHKN
jgi:hypothetical protein